ncbi:hypothetical protein PoB_004978300 [Plakobranchus ocellatus]|uniref:Uncharacterized protein n=1 Tax=Plakobranchus ocellatus TaxID=259542 RepID=A0AAV4BWU9_9GAST|nr:hypothetical protein PoB_004978300 [Plakobranchus ocellatus]
MLCPPSCQPPSVSKIRHGQSSLVIFETRKTHTNAAVADEFSLKPAGHIINAANAEITKCTNNALTHIIVMIIVMVGNDRTLEQASSFCISVLKEGGAVAHLVGQSGTKSEVRASPSQISFYCSSVSTQY